LLIEVVGKETESIEHIEAEAFFCTVEYLYTDGLDGAKLANEVLVDIMELAYKVCTLLLDIYCNLQLFSGN
jgi:hypothetical protein